MFVVICDRVDVFGKCCSYDAALRARVCVTTSTAFSRGRSKTKNCQLTTPVTFGHCWRSLSGVRVQTWRANRVHKHQGPCASPLASLLHIGVWEMIALLFFSFAFSFSCFSRTITITVYLALALLCTSLHICCRHGWCYCQW